MFFPVSQPPRLTLLSSDADFPSLDMNLDKAKRAFERCPMLMLRTTRVFLDGLFRTCFSTVVFFATGAVTTISRGWLKGKEPLSSTGKSVMRIPPTW